MKKNLAKVGILLIPLTIMTGCNNSEDTKVSTAVESIEPLSLDEVASKRVLSQNLEERAAEFTELIEDKKVVNSQNLSKVATKDRNAIIETFSKINAYLTGAPNSEQVITNNQFSDNYANYLLLEMANTPYEWRQINQDVLGYDPKTRLYFVDVTYQTTGNTKLPVPNSRIPLGHPDSEELLAKRYQEYMAFGQMRHQIEQSGGSASDLARVTEAKRKFENKWGTIDSILWEQQNVPLIERTRQQDKSTGGLGKLTYNGLIINDKMSNLGAKMTIRFVLKYRLNLGEETDLYVASAYLKDYELLGADKVLEQYTLKDKTTVSILKPFIDRLITSYNKAVEESNLFGLYSMYQNFSNWDKYYDEMDKYMYTSYGGYTFQILSRDGSDVLLKVTQSLKYRAKVDRKDGTESSLPQYIGTYLYHLVLGKDDKIYISSIVPLKKELIGEPESVIKNVTTISDTIEYSKEAFSEDNAKKVNELLQRFAQVVVNNDGSSDEFLATVDMGVSNIALNRIVDTIKSIQAEREVMYIINWESRTNTFASARVKELFQRKDVNYETESEISMVNRGGTWKVIDYARKLNLTLPPKTLDGGEYGATKPIADVKRTDGLQLKSGEKYKSTDFETKVDESAEIKKEEENQVQEKTQEKTQPQTNEQQVQEVQEQPQEQTDDWSQEEPAQEEQAQEKPVDNAGDSEEAEINWEE